MIHAAECSLRPSLTVSQVNAITSHCLFSPCRQNKIKRKSFQEEKIKINLLGILNRGSGKGCEFLILPLAVKGNFIEHCSGKCCLDYFHTAVVGGDSKQSFHPSRDQWNRLGSLHPLFMLMQTILHLHRNLCPSSCKL